MQIYVREAQSLSCLRALGDRGHWPCNRHGPKRGGLLCPFRGQLAPPLISVAWAEVYFRTKWRLHPSSRLATIDMGQELGVGGCAFLEGELGTNRTQSRLGTGL